MARDSDPAEVGSTFKPLGPSQLERPHLTEPLELFLQVLAFVAGEVVPNLKAFVVDEDRITAICTSIFNQAILPILRTKTKSIGLALSLRLGTILTVPLGCH
jgi:hypothetical protein